MSAPIDPATFHRMAPELTNQWMVVGAIEHARTIGRGLAGVDAGEAFAWGVAYAMRLERTRLAQLVDHFGKLARAPNAGERLARRLVYTVRYTRAAAAKAWKASGVARG